MKCCLPTIHLFLWAILGQSSWYLQTNECEAIDFQIEQGWIKKNMCTCFTIFRQSLTTMMSQLLQQGFECG
jgi:hypothetical protein